MLNLGGGADMLNLGGVGGGGTENIGGGATNIGGGGGGTENIGGGATLSATTGALPLAIAIPHSNVQSLLDPDCFLYIQYYTQQILCLEKLYFEYFLEHSQH